MGTVTYAANQCWYAILHRPPFPASGSGPACLLLSLMTLASGTFIAWRCVNAGQQAPANLAMASLEAAPGVLRGGHQARVTLSATQCEHDAVP